MGKPPTARRRWRTLKFDAAGGGAAGCADNVVPDAPGEPRTTVSSWATVSWPSTAGGAAGTLATSSRNVNAEGAGIGCAANRMTANEISDNTERAFLGYERRWDFAAMNARVSSSPCAEPIS